jgi:F0F1-type ATP synthase assembly protein I
MLGFLDPQAFTQACAPPRGRTCDMPEQPPSRQDTVETAPDAPPSPRRASPHANLNAGYTLVASVILGLGLGYAVDLWLDTAPWCSVGGALLFIVAGLYQVVKEAQR